MSSQSPIQPHFTTSPLYHPRRTPLPTFTCGQTTEEPLTFPKVPLSSTTSTDSEPLSSDPCPTRSFSLLTSLIQSHPRVDPCQFPNGKAPPHVVNPFQSCGQPILRRNTSSSDDQSKLVGLGFSSIKQESQPSVPHLSRKQSCLTFAVRPCPRSSSPTRTPSIKHEESESDDEGYEEDEEGGFTSDEGHPGPSFRSGLSKWVTSQRVTTIAPMTRRKITTTSSTHTSTDDAPAFQGRRVSIASPNLCVDSCSRHLGPPPFCSDMDSAPPAARSPSAADLCRRRGWRSDDNAFLGRTGGRKGSLPDALGLQPMKAGTIKVDRTMVPHVSRRESEPASPFEASYGKGEGGPWVEQHPRVTLERALRGGPGR